MTSKKNITPGAALAALRRRVSKVCLHCGTSFEGLKKSKYCSDKCRHAATYKRRKS